MRANGVFYVGKGSGNRLDAHFLAADDLLDVPSAPERLRTIRRLVDSGISRDQIGYVVARVETELEAFLIEALLIKFVYGIANLTNQVAGHGDWAIRSRNCWDVLPGFDLPSVVNPGKRQDRAELLPLLLAEGLSISLDYVRERLEAEPIFGAGVNFGDYKVLDAGELGMEAPLGGTWLKVFTRRKRIQLELRPRTKTERAWMRDRFATLGASELLRGDAVFIPPPWRGAREMTIYASEALDRAKLLIELAVVPVEGLSDQARSLLDPPGDALVQETPPNGNGPIDSATTEPTPLQALVPQAQTRAAPPPAAAVAPAPAIDPCCLDRLQAVADCFPDIMFDEPRSRDAGEIAIEGLIGAEGTAPGAFLKISCRKRGIGFELRGRTRDRKAWLHAHLSQLGCTLPRAMNSDQVVFLPTSWQGNGIAPTIEVAAHRIALLLKIVFTTDPDELDAEARALLVP